MGCAVLEDDSDDGASLPNGSAARPLRFGGLDPEITRNVAVDRTHPEKVPHLCRPTALPATDKVCRIVDFGLTSLEIRATAGLRGGRLRSALARSDCVLRTKQGVHADAAFRTGVPLLALCADDPAVLEKGTTRSKADQSVPPRITRGPLQNLPDQAASARIKRGTILDAWPRDWDSATWPNADAGFIKAYQDILRIFEEARTA